jgi:hypothetical protein
MSSEKIKDSVGNEIHTGAIIRVFHFQTSRKKYYMYKQVGTFNRQAHLFEVFHLPFGTGSYFTADFVDAVVVSCQGEYYIHHDLKRNKKLSD